MTETLSNDFEAMIKVDDNQCIEMDLFLRFIFCHCRVHSSSELEFHSLNSQGDLPLQH